MGDRTARLVACSFLSAFVAACLLASLGAPSPVASQPEPAASSDPEPSGFAGRSPVAGCPEFFSNMSRARLDACIDALAPYRWALGATHIDGDRWSGGFQADTPRREIGSADFGALDVRPLALVGYSDAEGSPAGTFVLDPNGAPSQCGQFVVNDTGRGYPSAYAAIVRTQSAIGCVPAGMAVNSDDAAVFFVPGNSQDFASVYDADRTAFHASMRARGFTEFAESFEPPFELWGRDATAHRVVRVDDRTNVAAMWKQASDRAERLVSVSDAAWIWEPGPQAKAACTTLPCATLVWPQPDARSRVHGLAGRSPVDGCPEFFSSMHLDRLWDCIDALETYGWGVSAIENGRSDAYAGAFAAGIPRRGFNLDDSDDVVSYLTPGASNSSNLDELKRAGGPGKCRPVEIATDDIDNIPAAKMGRLYLAAEEAAAARGCVPSDAVFAPRNIEPRPALLALAPGDPKATVSLFDVPEAAMRDFERRAAARGLQPLTVRPRTPERPNFEVWTRSTSPHRIVVTTMAKLLIRWKEAEAREDELLSISQGPAQTLTLVFGPKSKARAHAAKNVCANPPCVTLDAAMAPIYAARLAQIAHDQPASTPAPVASPAPSASPSARSAPDFDGVEPVSIGTTPVPGCPRFFIQLPLGDVDSCAQRLTAFGWGLSAVQGPLLGSRFFAGAFEPNVPLRVLVSDRYDGSASPIGHMIDEFGYDDHLVEEYEAGRTSACGDIVIDDRGFHPKEPAFRLKVVAHEASLGCVPGRDITYNPVIDSDGTTTLINFVTGDPAILPAPATASDRAAYEKRAAALGFPKRSTFFKDTPGNRYGEEISVAHGPARYSALEVRLHAAMTHSLRPVALSITAEKIEILWEQDPSSGR